MRAKIIKLENNLHDTNDLALAQLEGEDMTEFGDIITYRHELRVQIAALKARVAEMLSAEGPYLLECAVKEEDNVLPMITPGSSVDEMILEVNL